MRQVRFRSLGSFMVGAFLLLLGSTPQARADLPVRGGGPHDDEVVDMVMGKDGSVIATGYFGGTAVFGDVELRSQGGTDIFVVKSRADGSVLWAVSAGGPEDDVVGGIDIDSSGNAYIVGDFSGSIHFGGVVLQADGSRDGFVARIESNGEWGWAVGATGPDREVVSALAVRRQVNADAVFVGGSFEHSLDIGGKHVERLGSGRDYFVAKLDPDNGSAAWVNFEDHYAAYSVQRDVAVEYMAFGDDGSLYVAGPIGTDVFFNHNILLEGGDIAGRLISGDTWQVAEPPSLGRCWTLQDMGGNTFSTVSLRRGIDLPANSQPVLDFFTETLFGNFPNPCGRLFISRYQNGSWTAWEEIESAGGVFLENRYQRLVDPASDPTHPWAGFDAWDQNGGLGGNLFTVRIDLSNFAGETIDLAWIAARDPSLTASGGWHLDNISLADGNDVYFFTDNEIHPRYFVARLGRLDDSSSAWDWARSAPLDYVITGLAVRGGRVVTVGHGVPTGAQGYPWSRMDFGSAGWVDDSGLVVAEATTANGDWVWARNLGTSTGRIRDVTLDGSGNIYVVGSFEGTETFGAETLSSSGGRDVFVASLTGGGDWRWVTGGDRYDESDGIPGHAGGPGDDEGTAIVYDGVEALYIGGSFHDTAVFGQQSAVTSVGAADTFMAELLDNGRWAAPSFWIVGQEVPPPDDAWLTSDASAPELYMDGQLTDLSRYFLWSPPIPGRPEGKLYAIQPVSGAELRWKVSSDLSDQRRYIRRGSSIWPAEPCSPSSDGPCYQIHVHGAPVEVTPDDGHLTYTTLFEPDIETSHPRVQQGIFETLNPGWVVLEYVDGPEADPTRYPVVLEVVRSLRWEHVPGFTDVEWPIGTPITDALHDEPGRTGYVLNERAFYDGVGPRAAYNRNARTGQIIPVNRVNPNRPEDRDREMVVAWYRRNHNRVYWSDRAIRYQCYWPLDPDVIIVASEQGGEVRGQAPLDSVHYPGAFIYHQDDPNLPGYNPNDEHAMMLPSNTGSGVDAVFALRADFGSDLNPHTTDVSDPYVLVKYEAGSGRWAYRIYKVLATSPDYPNFSFQGTAGTRIQPPYPLSLFPSCDETSTASGGTSDDPEVDPFFRDVHDDLWGRSAGEGVVYYYYPLQAGFFYDVNGDGVADASEGECIPWMARLPEELGGSSSTEQPIPVTYNLVWPSGVPLLEAGETLITPKRGLPDIYHQAAVEVVYDERWEEENLNGQTQDPDAVLAQVIMPFEPRTVDLDGLPTGLATEQMSDGTVKILGTSDGTVRLPVTLRRRLRYDPLNGKLTLRGLYDDSEAGEPLVVLNVMSQREREMLLDLSDDGDWREAVEDLFLLSRNPNHISTTVCSRYEWELMAPWQACESGVTLDLLFGFRLCKTCVEERTVTVDDILIGWQDSDGNGFLEPLKAVGGHPALTAGAASGSGYVTLAFNNDPSLGDLPVSLEVIRVGCLEYPEPPADPEIVAPYQGEVKVLLPDNVFDESVTLHFNGDFGGRMDRVEFQWFYHPDEDGTPPEPLPDPEHGQLNGWIEIPLDDPVGAQDITVGGANLQSLSDNWYVVRYRGLKACDNETEWSLWTGQPGSTPLDPRGQLVEGWVKRVEEGLNPFEARVRDFHRAATNTYATMIEQLGPRYEGDIALNPSAENLNSIGLIEAYETVLHRARMLSIDGTPPVDYGPANNVILNVTSRIADFYKLLGDEAFADAEDPTVGITTDELQFGIGSLAPSIFNFENQVPNLLEEELVLLRGRDDRHEAVTAPPVYNRFYWNFTGGNGEVAYTLSYDIHDINLDGFIDARDAKIQFPQGHGDAWGHLLTAMTHYYDLLRHPYFTWVPRPEAVLVAGVPVQVDYFDERKFASIAAQRALVGARIVSETYRDRYSEDPHEQWQGYKDPDRQRAWGLDGWGRRGAMGAYFDWVTGTSLLPAEDPNPEHTGIQKIDRTTVKELAEIVSHYEAIQAEIDAADRGLNPLGVLKGAVPFDIDPAQVDQGKTHFEQIYDRAAQALDSAVKVWDYANELNRMLRFNQDDVQKMRLNVQATELDFKNQLVEIFGYPYPDDIGPGGTYPDGYDGPDLYHYMYIDAPALEGTAIDETTQLGEEQSCFTVEYQAMENGLGFFLVPHPVAAENGGGNADEDQTVCIEEPEEDGCPLGGRPDATIEVEYCAWQFPDGAQVLSKPTDWTGERRAIGRIQEALYHLRDARADLRVAEARYIALRKDIEGKVELLKETYDIREAQIEVADEDRKEITRISSAIQGLLGSEFALELTVDVIKEISEGLAACVPRNEIVGLADGGDLLAQVRCGLKLGARAAFSVERTKNAVKVSVKALEQEKEKIEQLGALKIRIGDALQELDVIQAELEELIHRKEVLAAEVYAKAQRVEEAMQEYLKALAEGERVLNRLMTFRKNTAAAVQEYRYEDMAFRIFRNDALQKYHAMFDMAARYTYLAATAYDYDTNLLGTDGKAGRTFLEDIVKQRSLGQVLDHEPVPDTPGLADAMGKMKLNFEVLKGQMGFNDPEIETDRISLRHELFRLKDDADGDAAWREKLEAYRVDDLWSVPEFRRFMRPFAPESAGPQPAIVIPFSTTVSWDLNVFGWRLGPGDHAFDSSRFATRIRGVGVWFDGYDQLPLSATPRVYLVPVGSDFLRAPTTSDDRSPVRQWKVMDQILPVPYPLDSDDLAEEGWTPIADALSGSFGVRRKHPLFRAFGDPDGAVDPDEVVTDSRLISRSVWNSRWLLVIPGAELLSDAEGALDTFIEGQELPDGSGRDGNGVRDIEIVFETYSYEGLK